MTSLERHLGFQEVEAVRISSQLIDEGDKVASS